MSTRVLVAYDGSSGADAAAVTAGRLFPAADGRVVTIVDLPPGVAQVRALGARLDAETLERGVDRLVRRMMEAGGEVAARGVTVAESAGLTLEPHIVPQEGSRWRTIVAAAEAIDADVIVCGSRGRGGVARSLLGSTSTGVLHHATRPVLVVPAAPAAVDGPVLIAYDGSDGAQAAVAAAGQLLRERPAVVARVGYSAIRHTLSGRALAGAPVGDLREISADYERAFAEAAAAEVEEGVALARQFGLDAAGEAVESSSGAWRALAAAAHERRAAVIVTGSRGRGGVAATVLGSVSSGLVHNAETPTLVVRR
jgi:nucleotide-binding universal stress UspA family protein